MSQPVYTLEEIANMTRFSEQALRLAITQKYNDKTSAKVGRRLHQLRAKQGSGNQYLVLENDLRWWLDELPDAQ